MSTVAEPQTQEQPAQRFGTEGIKPMARPSRMTRLFMAIVAFVERLNVSLSKVGNPPIYDNAAFPWAKEVEREWRAIRAELDRVLTRKDDLPGFHELSTDVATISQDKGWKTFFLSGYGFKSANNIKACPDTWRICQKIPGLITVMYSILEPGKHLPAHRGPYNGVLRLHLGLPGQYPQLAAAESCRVHALHPRGHGQPGGLGEALLRGSRGAAESVVAVVIPGRAEGAGPE